MKALSWVLIVIWGFATLSFVADILSGASVDVYTDLISIVLGGTQIYFNHSVLKYLK